ncbi:nucleotide sugar dehydrogenase [Gammaproteobacteria bacterium]|nr:nucleotide sugar dehydrogenase [Gammaproteobacteria bacterium]
MKLKMKHKISIVGMGYVGCGNALMLAKNNQVSIVDIDTKKVNDFNAGRLPISDTYAQKFLDQQELDISSTIDLNESIKGSSFVILALPTNFDEGLMKYDTHILDAVAEQVLQNNHRATIVIRSTVDIGHTEYLKQKLNTQRILFSPEFLREGHALEDSLHPSRIIIGGKDSASKKFSELMLEAVNDTSAPILMMESSEAESVKLFANTYLAMRVAFFNELDSFCLDNQIDSQEVINGICLDGRIGSYYNNPSFGFGGLCLPKDSMQLLQRFKDTPGSIIHAIQDSNKERAAFLVDQIASQHPKIVGVYRLAMKSGSDNSRNASIFKIIEGLLEKNITIIIYDDSTNSIQLEGVTLVKDFEAFANNSDLIITNRLDDQIQPFSNKVFSRDIFSTD